MDVEQALMIAKSYVNIKQKKPVHIALLILAKEMETLVCENERLEELLEEYENPPYEEGVQ